MPAARTKWHHRLLGTADQRRRWRAIMLLRLGLARSHMPMQLIRSKNPAVPNIVRGLAAEILLRKQSLTFVQVGAFDGTSDDDLTALLPLGNVDGVLIEPQPEAFAQLQNRFGDAPNLHLSNVAIAAEIGWRDFYSTRNGASRLASFNRQNLLMHGVSAKEIVSKQVRCLPLDRLLDDLAISKVDVLQIDAEGYDLEVLATLDLDRWQPNVIRFEYIHLPSAKVDACIANLAERGYCFMVQERDLVACLPTESKGVLQIPQ